MANQAGCSTLGLIIQWYAHLDKPVQKEFTIDISVIRYMLPAMTDRDLRYTLSMATLLCRE